MKTKRKMKTKRFIVVCIVMSLCVTMVALITSCASTEESTDDEYDYSDNKDYSETKSISESEAISIAKNSSVVQKNIAKAWDMKFFYTPEWGTCTAEKKSNGGWEVVLKGNISGYTDDYKDDFIYDKKFKAEVTISPTGNVSYVYVSREY